MEYHEIILELLSRIKKLESDVAQLKEAAALHLQGSAVMPEMRTSSSYKKMTEDMIDLCYTYGKESVENQELTPWALAVDAANKHGMNKSSAFMYITAVKCMLDGKIYKRAINSKAIKKYFSSILSDYGKEGLKKALKATKLHIEYRKGFNQPVNSIEKICSEFEAEL